MSFVWDGIVDDRLTLANIKYEDLWRFYKTLHSSDWTPEEVDLSNDHRDWELKMTADERKFVIMQLAFFSRFDIDVFDNIDDNLSKEITCMEAKAFYAMQKVNELVHAQSYAAQIMAVIKDPEEQARILNAVRTMPIIAKIHEWIIRWFEPARPIGERLIAFAFVEGVLFSASFSSLQWLRERNLLSGITLANSYIVRDEGLHAAFTCLLVRKYLLNRPPQSCVAEIIGQLFVIMEEFVSESLPVNLIGMNKENMLEYIRYQADSIIIELGYVAITHARNPFLFMDKLQLNDMSKSNFFERRPTDYQRIVNCKLHIDAS